MRAVRTVPTIPAVINAPQGFFWLRKEAQDKEREDLVAPIRRQDAGRSLKLWLKEDRKVLENSPRRITERSLGLFTCGKFNFMDMI